MNSLSTQPLPLLEKYGFNEVKRQTRLRCMGLNSSDIDHAKQLNRHIIQPSARQIIEEFYEFLVKIPEMQRLLPIQIIPQLKRTQEEYLLSFGIDFDTPYYFEYRLRIGIAHERVGLSLDLYQAAYRHMTSLILGCVPEEICHDTVRYQPTYNLILKIAALDMSLATDTYIGASVATMSDSIRQLSEQRRDLISAISHDALTGVYSRRYLLEHLANMIQGKQRHDDKTFCIAMLDLDYFKKINDTHGHLIGDQVLQYVSKIMKQSIRNVDLLGRFGGEEFMIILPGTDLTVASQTAERIRHNISEHPLVVDDQNFIVTVSIGIAEHQSDEPAVTLIERADKALYGAKAAGRNCVKTEVL